MDLASSAISVEKSRADPDRAGVPKKLDRWVVRHEIVALILTGIRSRVPKRRSGKPRGQQPSNQSLRASVDVVDSA